MVNINVILDNLLGYDCTVMFRLEENVTRHAIRTKINSIHPTIRDSEIIMYYKCNSFMFIYTRSYKLILILFIAEGVKRILFDLGDAMDDIADIFVAIVINPRK